MSYKAFMSYSHAVDARLAVALQSALHRFARPWHRLRAVKVFRDKSSLSASSALWPSIEAALRDSEYLLLLASPEAARSIWVSREVDWWLSNRSVRQLLIIVTDGDLAWDTQGGDFDWSRSSALPGILRGRLNDEPLYVDLRWAKSEDALSLRHSQFRAAVLDIAAPLHGKLKDELDGEDVHQYRRTRAVMTAAMVAIVAFACTAAWQAYVATRARDAAQRQATLNLSDELAVSALNNLGIDPERSLLLAIESALLGSSVQTTIPDEAQSALHSAIAASRVRLTLPAHERMVIGAAFSPDGSRIATCDWRQVQIWDAVSGTRVAVLPTEHGRVLAVTYSPDGRYLATAGRDGVARLWDTTTGSEWRRFDGHSRYLWQVAFSPDGRRLSAAGHDMTASVWDITSGQRLLLRGHDGGITDIAFSGDGRRLATGSTDGKVILWDSTTGAELLTIAVRGESVKSVAFSPDGKLVAVGTLASAAPRVFDSGTGQQLKELEGHVASIFSVRFSPDGEWLATASHDKNIRLWSVATGEQRLVLAGHSETVTSVAFSFDGSRIVSTSEDGTARAWDIGDDSELPMLRGHTDNVLAVAFNADDSRIATASADSTARIWNAVTAEEVLVLTGHRAAVNDVAFSPDGKFVATASADKSARIWEADTGRQLSLFAHTAAVNAIAYSRDGHLLVTGNDEGTTTLWDTVTVRQTSTLELPAAKIKSVEFSPDGQRIAIAAYTLGHDATTTTRLWAPASQSIVRGLAGDSLWVNQAVFSPDGGTIATAGSTPPYLATLWDAASGRKQLEFAGHPDAILGIAFSPDGSRLASVGNGAAARVWDRATGRELFTLSGQVGWHAGVVFSTDGRRVVTAGGGWTASIYTMDSEELIALAESRITRPLSATECRQFLKRTDCSGTLSGDVWQSLQMLQQSASSGADTRPAIERDREGMAARMLRAQAAAFWTRQGREYARVGKRIAATRSFARAMEANQALGFDPDIEARRLTARSQIALARRLEDQGDLDGAIAAYLRALDSRRTAATFTDLGWIYQRQRRFDSAIESAAQAWKIDASYAPAYSLASTVHHDDLHDYEAAYRDATRAFETGGQDPGYKANLAEVSLTSGRFALARRLATELTTDTGARQALGDSSYQAVQFILIAALMLDGEADEARRRIDSLRAFQQTLPATFATTWSFAGTRHFIRTQAMTRSSRALLLSLLDTIEKSAAA